MLIQLTINNNKSRIHIWLSVFSYYTRTAKRKIMIFVYVVGVWTLPQNDQQPVCESAADSTLASNGAFNCGGLVDFGYASLDVAVQPLSRLRYESFPQTTLLEATITTKLCNSKFMCCSRMSDRAREVDR